VTSKDLTIGSIPLHVRDLALPASVGLFFQTMYNVVDTYYAGHLSENALAAVGLSFPVFLLVIAASSGLSRGSSGLISNAIGAKLFDDQKRYTVQAVVLAVFLSCVLSVVGLLIADPIFRFLGADGEFLRQANDYITPIFLGSVFFIVGGVCNAILTSSGDTKTYGSVLIVGFFLNLILDPWFMNGGYGLPPMKVSGIAWATVVIQFFGSAFLLTTVIRRGLLRLDFWQELIPKLNLEKFGVAAVAAYAATTRIEQIALMPTFGLYAAIMALVGQNNGAGNDSRVRETINFCNRVGVTLNLIMSLLMFLFSRQLMDIFTDDPQVIEFGVTCISVIAPIQWSYILTATHIAMLQALKRPAYGFFEAITRKIILPLPILWLLIVYWGKDIEWIWYCNAVINVLMTGVTIFYARKVLNRLKSE